MYFVSSQEIILINLFSVFKGLELTFVIFCLSTNTRDPTNCIKQNKISKVDFA